MRGLPIAIAKNDGESSAIRAYLDIETTGLSPVYSEITVIGIRSANGSDDRLVRLVGKRVKRKAVLEVLEGVHTIYTYNGQRFDLPFIHACVGVDLNSMHNHRDLMYDCWRCNLKGGFKAVEAQPGIPRQLKGIGGYEAVLLWRRYCNYGDRRALTLLLQYNKEDVMNLAVLKERLTERNDYHAGYTQ